MKKWPPLQAGGGFATLADRVRTRSTIRRFGGKTMSVAYIYMNPDKKQFYHCGLLGFGSHFSAIGKGPGARALALLLSDRGTWKNDRISVVGDTSIDFENVYVDGTDIEVEVELMLLDVDGPEWLEELLEESIIAFRTVCALAIQLRRPDVIKLLDKKFGVGKWQRTYENELKGNTDFWSQKIVDAGQRSIQLLT
jgi:hypothetical protein